jgi:hypothetical protein
MDRLRLPLTIDFERLLSAVFTVCKSVKGREGSFVLLIEASIRVRRCAPLIGGLGEVSISWIVIRARARGEPVALGWVDASVLGEGGKGRFVLGFGGLDSESDDSVFGVVELQSVRGVGELSSIRVRRCASRVGVFGQVGIRQGPVRAPLRGEPGALGRVGASTGSRPSGPQ